MSVWALATLCTGMGIAISVIGYALILGVGPVPTSRTVRQCLNSILPDGINTVAELGCGWGTLLPTLSRHYPNAKITAYERSPVPWVAARLFSAFRRNIRVRRHNFYRTPLHDADLVVCYLYPGAMRKLSEKFRKELKEGTWIISHTFALPDWTPERLIHAGDLYHTPIYLYQWR